jgi:phytoene desaturase
MSKAIIIGSGVGGLATSIHLAKAGFEVIVIEKNDFVGGKVNSKSIGKYRFDMGPSVFTSPELVDELIALSPKLVSFDYVKLEESCRYFFSDGQQINLPAQVDGLVDALSKEFAEDHKTLRRELKKRAKNYQAAYPVFITVSLHRWKEWLNKHLIAAIIRIPKFGLLRSMASVNRQKFKHPHTQQIFNRFATYNGSSPYKSPGMLNIISHLELNIGPFMPKGGIVSVSQSLYQVAINLGVTFHLNETAIKIEHDQKKVGAVQTTKSRYDADIIVSNMDVHFTYEKLLDNFKAPKTILLQEKSSSAIVFYWGIKKEFPSLGIHNIFFAENYEEEFKDIFDRKTLSQDPTIYVHISSKQEKTDAPEACENWFVMVNSPIDVGQNWEEAVSTLRKHLIKRLSYTLKEDIASLIEVEDVMHPQIIESRYFGKQGSIYGNSSNSASSAFYRHPNFSKSLKGLYFSGVTVHPGGGIPLALNSAKIVARLVAEDLKNS